MNFLFHFLSERKQRVRVNNDVSEWALVTSNVPQGSVLGPILFSLVIDSYSPVCDNSVCIKYADDVTILHFVRDVEEDNLQCEWEHLDTWSDSVGLYLNNDKSCVLNYVTKKSLNLSCVLSRDSVILSTVSSVSL